MSGGRPDLPEVPDHLPRAPGPGYARKGWRGWCDFLGTGRVSKRLRVFRSFEAAREFARTLGLRSGREWREWSRGDRADLPPRPLDIPGKPHVRYEEFTSWADFLGADRDARGRKPASQMR